VRDTLRVGLGEAHLHLGLEVEVHRLRGEQAQETQDAS
jgi:hypothetical protein